MNNHSREDPNLSTSPHSGVLGWPINADPLWTVDEVAVFLKLQPETIRSMARRGELPAIKLGKVWRFEKSAILAMLMKLG